MPVTIAIMPPNKEETNRVARSALVIFTMGIIAPENMTIISYSLNLDLLWRAF